MVNFLRKSALISLLTAFSVVSLFGAPVVAYAKVDKPKISISERGSDFVILKIKQSDLKKDKVTIRVSIEKMATGEKFNQTFKVKLNSDGQKKITLKDLISNNEYKVKAKIKKRGQDSYSNFSRTIKFSTK